MAERNLVGKMASRASQVSVALNAATQRETKRASNVAVGAGQMDELAVKGRHAIFAAMVHEDFLPVVVEHVSPAMRWSSHQKEKT